LQKTHDRQRPLIDGSPTFEHIINNLKLIKEQVKNRTITFSIRTNFTKEIFEDIHKYIDFFYENFGDDDRFSFFIRPVMDWGGERVKSFKESMFDDKDTLSGVYNELINSQKRLNMNYEGFFEPGGSVCYAAKKNAFIIDSRGNIHKCTCDFNNEKNSKIGEIDSAGNMVLDQYKQALWLCETETCQNYSCSFRGSCLGECCPAKRVIKKLKSPVCPIEKEYIEDTLCLLDKNNHSFSYI